ncbi:polysaccharide deacetylase [Gracilaria domingensis]|nr:polysaccharide deacetylase [Gracilaria domingensis]
MDKTSVALKPSLFSQSQFVKQFGSVFEHSPWVAERSYANISSVHDSAEGVHEVLCRTFRVATKEERLEVLRAHPDLAGKLAQAKRLTKDSGEEQASAGLDALTDEEREKFTVLNERYKLKHEFPFIMAVRNQTKQSILEAFERRVRKDTLEEMEEACNQVETIARFRIEKVFIDYRDANLTS